MSVATLSEPQATSDVAPSKADLNPVWDVALLFPYQGNWSKYDYLDLPGNHLVEFDNGRIEVLPMPSIRHQVIVTNLLVPMSVYAEVHELGKVLCAPMPLEVAPHKYREPDVIYTRSVAPEESDGDKYLDSAELVIEIVSEGSANRKRDLIDKRVDYAKAGIAEYWIVDPERNEVSMLVLQGAEYTESAVFGMNDVIRSTALPGFEIAVSKVFAK
jgi:Uma2 family endonuclease